MHVLLATGIMHTLQYNHTVAICYVPGSGEVGSVGMSL
jgi:hypothetical protein